MSSSASRGSAYVLLQLALLALIGFGPRALGGEASWPAPWGVVARLAGAGLAVIGVGLSSWGAVRLGRNLTPFPRPRERATLVVTGPYRVVRHPIYAGLILMAFGWALVVNGGLTALYALGLVLVLDAKTRYEERLLGATFEGYAEYRRRVRKLVPFVY